MEEIGYNRHGDDLPEPAPKLVRMAEECDRLSAERDKLMEEKKDCEAFLKELRLLDMDTKEKILSEYEEKIETCAETYRAISQRLYELGYSA
ncbi:hypothetical protein [Massiliimalia timonensis]|uniref:hypothetical protein n=1 Tax=Massiliimalia timonensis TaxID=1987501 RepID=UPI000B8B4BCC|nr:hypothetical protein [Massiliimalia timonensis]MBS7174603.1 hypothetical protein [Clostridiales bacterium]